MRRISKIKTDLRTILCLISIVGFPDLSSELLALMLHSNAVSFQANCGEIH